MRELCRASARLELSGLVATCPHVPGLIAATQVSHVSVAMHSLLQSAQAARLLLECPAISWLECFHNLPAHFPPSLKRLTVKGCDSERLQALFPELPHCWRLTRLDIDSGAVSLPAALASMLPPALQRVSVSLKLWDDDSEQSSGSEDDTVPHLDLGAFAAEAGCRCSLTLRIDVEGLTDRHAESLDRLQADMQAVPGLGLDLLEVHASEATADAVCDATAPVQCQCLSVRIHRCNVSLLDDAVHINALAVCNKLSIEFSNRGQQRALHIAWAALAGSGGVRSLGTPHNLIGAVHVEGFTGPPVMQKPWVLILWTQSLARVSGVPRGSFVQEQSSAHVWRNAAAADMKV